jgi:endonuclease/exonuclease/phosphatase family metal-dependent hydrolase
MPITASATTGLFDDAVSRLAPVPPEQRAAIRSLAPTRIAHAQSHAAIAAFRQVETGGEAAGSVAPVRIAAWNLERCLYPDAAADLLRAHGADLSLLTEMDNGMLRTGQAHTIAEVARGLGQRYANGLEFLELLPMPPPPGHAARGADNERGFHGNGFVSALAFEEPAVIRLDETADWFVAPKGGQRRVGNRLGVAATFAAGGFRFLGCAVHLESATDGMGRASQMHTLLDTLDGIAAGLPVVIGGDLNAQVEPGGHDDPAEPMFAVARKRGYDMGACNLAHPTTRASVWTEGKGTRQLDWFLTRGLAARDPEVIPALAPDGTVLSDHELILVTVAPA